MSIVATYQKASTTVLDYSIDWADFLAGDTIISSSWAVSPSGLTIDSDSETTARTTVWVSGGTGGIHYTLTNTIVTAAGRTDQRAILISIGGGFDPALSTDRDRVRFHIGDTDNSALMLEDRTIDALLISEGSIGAAVIACLRYLITQVSRPNYRADWLQVDNRAAVQSLRELLTEKQKEFGIASYSAEIGYLWRIDSDQTDTPDYSA